MLTTNARVTRGVIYPIMKNEPLIDDLLIFSCRSGNLDLIYERINQGANVNYQNKDGLTPILVAIKSGHFSVIKVLIEKGANFSCKDHYGNNALDYASEFRNKEIATALYDHGAYLSPNASPLAKEWFIKTIKNIR